MECSLLVGGCSTTVGEMPCKLVSFACRTLVAGCYRLGSMMIYQLIFINLKQSTASLSLDLCCTQKLRQNLVVF